jgi:hypothetical protein
VSAPQKIRNLVHSVLRSEFRFSPTVTVKACAAKVMTKITSGGGPSHFGIGAAYVVMACHRMVQGEIKRQLLEPLPENVFRIAFRSAPPQLVQEMKRLPYCIALEKGPMAPWRESLKATPSEWMMNYRLKATIARNTAMKARLSQEVAAFLTENGLTSLSETITIAT